MHKTEIHRVRLSNMMPHRLADCSDKIKRKLLVHSNTVKEIKRAARRENGTLAGTAGMGNCTDCSSSSMHVTEAPGNVQTAAEEARRRAVSARLHSGNIWLERAPRSTISRSSPTLGRQYGFCSGKQRGYMSP